MALALASCCAPSLAGDLPYAYEPLEYVASDGSAFVNTGIPSRDDVYVWIDMCVTGGLGGHMRADQNHNDMFGSCRAFDGRNLERCRLIHWNMLPWMQPQLGDGVNHADLNVQPNVRFAFALRVGQKGYMRGGWKTPGEFWRDGKRLIERGKSKAPLAIPAGGYSRPMYLFACNQNGKATHGAIARLYALTVWHTFETSPRLAFDAIPCREKASGRVGIYDTVSKRFFDSANPGHPLVAGPEMCGKAFVESRAAVKRNAEGCGYYNLPKGQLKPALKSAPKPAPKPASKPKTAAKKR